MVVSRHFAGLRAVDPSSNAEKKANDVVNMNDFFSIVRNGGGLAADRFLYRIRRLGPARI